MPQDLSLLMRPPMPTEADEARSQLTADMHAVLDDDWDEILEKWTEYEIGEERFATWGHVDTSINDLGDLSRQLATPGLYGRRPVYRHEDPITEMVIGQGGQWDQAGITSKLQHVQYMALGLGDYLVRPHLDEKLNLSARLVSPHNTFVLAHQDYPERAVQLRELRLRWWEAIEEWVYAWDWYDIRKGHEAYKVVLAGDASGGRIKAGADVSNVFLSTEENPSGDWTGDAYPWHDDDADENIIPYSVYRSVDAARTWNFRARHGAYRGTLNSGLLGTYANQAARDASGTAVIAWGLVPIGGNVQNAGQKDQVKTVVLKAGGVLYHETDGQSQPGVKEVGPGAKLQELAEYARNYSARIMTRFGLSPSDVSRQSANPASASSLMVSDRGRRDYSRQVEPLFRRSDAQTLRVVAVMYQARGVPMPTTGYTVEYIPIPDSPQEQKEEREQLTWESDQGLLSPIDLYRQTHPGTSHDDAVAAIVKARVETIKIDEMTKRAVEAAGLAPDPEPEPEPVVDESADDDTD